MKRSKLPLPQYGESKSAERMRELQAAVRKASPQRGGACFREGIGGTVYYQPTVKTGGGKGTDTWAA